MGRSNQPMGLCSDAVSFLEKEKVTPESCPYCNRPFSPKSFPSTIEEIGEYEGYFDEKFPLLRYFLKDGRHADEYLQTVEYSGGPVMFLGLQVSDGTKFEWEDWEIQGYI